MKLEKRNQFAQLLKALNLDKQAAEIGVAEGGFSFFLLDHWPGVCYQVDPWQWQPTPGYTGHGTEDQDGRYLEILRKSKRYNGRSVPVRATSTEAVTRFKDGFFDFVYIDAIHTYECAKQDIALWFPKVRVGGILAGHDYLEGVFHGQDYGVKRAVDELVSASEGKLSVNVIPEEWPSWWLVKQ